MNDLYKINNLKKLSKKEKKEYIESDIVPNEFKKELKGIKEDFFSFYLEEENYVLPKQTLLVSIEIDIEDLFKNFPIFSLPLFVVTFLLYLFHNVELNFLMTIPLIIWVSYFLFIFCDYVDLRMLEKKILK